MVAHFSSMATASSLWYSSKLDQALSVCSATYPSSSWTSRTNCQSFLHCCSSPFPYFSLFGNRSLESYPNQLRKDIVSSREGKHSPQCLYGLPATELHNLMDEDSVMRKKFDNLTMVQDHLSRPSILNQGGIRDMSSMKDTSVSMEGANMFFKRRRKNRKKAAPDLPSSLLRARICYLGMPIFPAVSELIVAQLIYLDSVDNTKPIHFYINSTGTLDENRQVVALENDAFAIADIMALCKAPIHTINCGVAEGQAALLLSLGTKGKRATMPNATVQLYLPKAENLSGSAADMWIQGKEAEINSEYYVDFLGKGTGKSKDEILNDISQSKHFLADEAIDYGIVDMVVDQMPSYEKPVPKKVRVRSKSRAPRFGSNGVPTTPPLRSGGGKPLARVRRVQPPSFVRLARASQPGK